MHALLKSAAAHRPPKLNQRTLFAYKHELKSLLCVSEAVCEGLSIFSSRELVVLSHAALSQWLHLQPPYLSSGATQPLSWYHMIGSQSSLANQQSLGGEAATSLLISLNASPSWPSRPPQLSQYNLMVYSTHQLHPSDPP